MTMFYLLSIVPSIMILEVYSHESSGALKAWKQENIRYKTSDQFFKSPQELSKILGPWNETESIYDFTKDHCEHDDSGSEDENAINNQFKLQEESCTCLSGDFYLSFTVNLGESVFKEVEILKKDHEIFKTLADVEPTTLPLVGDKNDITKNDTKVDQINRKRRNRKSSNNGDKGESEISKGPEE